MNKQKDRLVELIKQAKKQTKNASCDIERNMIFADYLLANGVLCKPFKIGEMVDVFFSRNAIVHIWCIKPDEEQYSISLWRGMAWDIPKEYAEMEFKKFFGAVPEHLHEADAINILVNLSREEAEAKLKEGVQG